MLDQPAAGRAQHTPFSPRHARRALQQAYRCACAADRTGHAMLHTLYGMAMKFNIQFFGEGGGLEGR